MGKVHKILEKAQMPDGTKIQIEDWTEIYPGIYELPMIAAYPRSKRDAMWWRRGDTFRLALDQNFTSVTEVNETFQRLQYGVVSLEDLEKHYCDDKARYYMGLVDTWDRPRERKY